MAFMTTGRKIVRLLILEDSQNEAARIVSLFRNAGHATRAHRIISLDDLNQALKSTWDLCIAAPHSEYLAPAVALQAIQRTSRDISFIQLIKSNASSLLTNALKLGAHNAVPLGEDEYLMLVAQQELDSLAVRRQLRSAEIALRETEKRCQLLLDSSLDAIAYVHDGMHIYANNAYLKRFGYKDAGELEGMPMIDLIASNDQNLFKDFLKNYRNEEGVVTFSCTGVTTAQENFPANMSFSPAHYDGEPCMQVVIRSEKHSADLEQKIHKANSQDITTGLYNRHYFIQLLNNATERSMQTQQPSSLAYIKIDNHSDLEATFGVLNIDLLVIELAKLLTQALNPDSQIARFSDAVFCVLLPNSTPEQHKFELDNLIQKVSTQLFDIDGRTAQTTLSAGLVSLNDNSSQPAEIIKRARYSAQQLPKGNGVKIYDPADELAAAASRGNIIAMVQQALDNNSFKLLFQPIISLRGDDNELYEVLLRLVNLQGEEVAPTDFLNAAIAAGFAEKIDRWVLENSIKLLKKHRDKGAQTRFFVHLSSASLQDKSLLPWLSTALKTANLPADTIILQIRETDAVTYLKPAKELIKGLREINCQVALDEFGCTLNPLNTLKHLDVEFVKIDSSFSKKLSSEDEQNTLKDMLANLHAQGKQSIVPAVESASTLSVLWLAEVNYVQGYYLQAPSQAINYDFSSHDM